MTRTIEKRLTVIEAIELYRLASEAAEAQRVAINRWRWESSGDRLTEAREAHAFWSERRDYAKARIADA